MDDEETRLVLRTSPALMELDGAAFTFIAQSGRPRRYATGDILMRQGDPGTSLHFILKGHVRAERRRRTDSRPVMFGEIGPGSVVGEIGVIVAIPRTATVVALELTETLELRAEDFDRLTKMYPSVNRVIARILSERMHGNPVGLGSADPLDAPRDPFPPVAGSPVGGSRFTIHKRQ